MNIRYDISDFEKVVKKEITVGEMAIKYGVSQSRIRQALNERGYHINKRIKIISPYKTVIVQDKQKCAEELNVSRGTIVRALKGIRVPTLDDLNIKLVYEDEDY